MCSHVQPAEAVNQRDVSSVGAELRCVNILERPQPLASADHAGVAVPSAKRNSWRVSLPQLSAAYSCPDSEPYMGIGRCDRTHGAGEVTCVCVCVSTSCWPLFRVLHRGPGAFRFTLHSFLLSNGRLSVGGLDSVWAFGFKNSFLSR